MTDASLPTQPTGATSPPTWLVPPGRSHWGWRGAVLPWNSPLSIAGCKVPAALAAGTTSVLNAATTPAPGTGT